MRRLAREALRTLGVAERWLTSEALAEHTAHADERIETDLVFAGLIGMFDPPRPEAKDAVARAKRAGIRPLMITGDHPTTAARDCARTPPRLAGEGVVTPRMWRGTVFVGVVMAVGTLFALDARVARARGLGAVPPACIRGYGARSVGLAVLCVCGEFGVLATRSDQTIRSRELPALLLGSPA
jgi:hypothetical protein